MRKEYQNNPHYQKGFNWNRLTAHVIAQLNFNDLKNEIKMKEELLQNFEEHFKWNMSNKDYAEAMGARDALIEAETTIQRTDEQRSNTRGRA